MNIPSDEQQLIIDHIKDGNNVVVDACAGSGKSTTILNVAYQLDSKKIMQLTYNSALRHEIRSKAKELSLDNMTVHTYHSLAVGFYDSSAYTDTGMRHILAQNTEISKHIDIDILVIDESQDMTLLYYRLIVKFICDLYAKNNKKIQVLILGDYKQGLYEFKGADIRFLTSAPEIWKHYDFMYSDVFIKCSLKMSYRITNQIRTFVNSVMLNEERMESCRDGPKVSYMRCNHYTAERVIVNKIKELMDAGSKQDDFFILAGSIKGHNIKRLENTLVMNGIDCFVPLFETDKLDERVIMGKIGLSTFHSVKGRQRKYVFVIGFDQNYFSYYGRNLNTYECPNTLYVAATRASEELFLCESSNTRFDRPLDFLTKSHNDIKKMDCVRFIGNPGNIFYERTTADQEVEIKKCNVTPTELIKFLHEDVLDVITPILNDLFVCHGKGETLDIPSVIQTQNGLYEEVSDLNGIAIPCMYYDEINRKRDISNVPVLYEMIELSHEQLDEKNEYISCAIDGVDRNMLSIEDYLYAANVFKAIDERLHSKLRQITYDDCCWLSEDDIDICKDRINTYIDTECVDYEPEAEFTIIHHSDEDAHTNVDRALEECNLDHLLFRFTARADLVTKDSVWEMKCTSEISLDHKIQVVIYAWLWNIVYPEDKKTFKIFNIKTCELMILNDDFENIDAVVKEVIRGKFIEPTHKDDDTFINDCIL
jgi:hypothetical protein